ncbi:hypothetical protein [Streptomyces sp. NPDC093225]|uniref:hypothetical protein n=1 Tax=Streptomyces sp. NPDC093225 TaxID=3366034 RepID=UPI0038282409
MAIVVVLQVAAWQGQVGGPARAAEQTAHRIGSSMLLVAPRGADADTTARFFESLPPTMVHLVAELSPERQSVTLSGDCVSLAVVHIECSKVKVLVTERPGDPRMQAVVGLNRLYVETVESLAFTENGMVTHLLVSGDGSDLPESEIARLAYREFSLGADVGVVGASWLGGAMVNQLQGEWLTLFGTLGVGTLGVAVLLSGLAEFLRLGRSIAPLAVLAGNRSIYWLVSVFALFLPILIAGIAGSVVGLWVALPQTKGGQGLISDQTVLACGTAALTVALVGWIWGAITAVKQADAWRSRDE